MTRASSHARARSARVDGIAAPLIWTFDGRFVTCLSDAEDTLRRAIPMLGDVARVAILIELSLPALKQRFEKGDAIQPAWGRFMANLARYGLPDTPRIRHTRGMGPVVTLVIAYRS